MLVSGERKSSQHRFKSLPPLQDADEDLEETELLEAQHRRFAHIAHRFILENDDQLENHAFNQQQTFFFVGFRGIYHQDSSSIVSWVCLKRVLVFNHQEHQGFYGF
jgi:hypothetical protein